MDLKSYEFSYSEHNGKNIIKIMFPNDVLLKRQLKLAVPTAKWSQTKKCWYVPYNNHFVSFFNMPPKSISASKEFANIHPVNQQNYTNLYYELKLKAYSENTIRTYLNEFAQLLHILKSHNVNSLSPDKLKSYFLYCITKLKLSENLLHSRINAIKFYFEQVLKNDKIMLRIPRPKKVKQLPKVLNKKRIAKIFDATINPKHKLMLKLAYGMGLRVSEIVSLRINDIDSQRMIVHIKKAKGKKDRIVTLPQSVLDEMRTYYKQFEPKKFLFEGQYGGKYATRSVQAVFKKALVGAGIRERIGIHALRHSYATHLLECGTDISLIQKLMGHNDIKTTLGYTHVSKKSIANVKSPLDNL